MAGAPANTVSIHVRFGEFVLDEANARLVGGQGPVTLAPTPFGLLCALVRRPGVLLTKHALLDEVWGHRFVSDSVLKGAVSDIRTALGDDPKSPRFIETVPRRGYRFVAESVGVGAELSRLPSRTFSSASSSGHRPGAGTMEPSPNFVGREPELSSLTSAWDSARSGRRIVAWVAGEPGIGKTALVERFIDRVGDANCVRGQCLQGFGTGEPYHAVLEAIGALARRDESVVELLRAVAPTWLLQIPWLSTTEQREALLRELVGVNPERMLREMGEFLDRYTEQRPLLLVTEDLHWADRATAQLIDYVARRRTPARLMWLSTFRLTEVVAHDHPLHALRHQLRQQGLQLEILLDSFTEREIAAYVAQRIPVLAQDEAFIKALHDRTEGVPLFVASVTNDVAARVGTDGMAAVELARIPVPRSLSALIDYYLARLDTSGRALLTAAAVCGPSFRIATVARVLERDVVGVSDDCEALAREHLWLVALDHGGTDSEPEEGQLAFRHSLYREALLHRATRSTRVDLHRRVAAALESERQDGTPITASELAAHFEHGRVPRSALRYYAEAAQTALRQLSPTECLSLTERALALLPNLAHEPENASYAITLSTLRGVAAFHALGAGDVARAAFAGGAARLAETPEHPLRGLLLHGLGFLLSLRAEYDDALLVAARAEALGDASDDVLLVVAASTVQGQVHNVQGRPDASRRALERALPAITSLSDASETRLHGFIADPQVTARAMLSLPLLHLGKVRQSRAHLDAAYERARRLGQPMAVMIVLWFDALCEIRLGDADRVANVASEMRQLVDEYSLTQGRTACQWFRGWAEARRGKPLEGFRRIREACDQNLALGMVSGASETLGYAAEALVAAGDLDAAQSLVEEARALVDRYGERIYLPQLSLIGASIARARGDAERATQGIRASIAEARSQGALWLELSGLLELVRFSEPSPDEISALDGLVARLDEAQQTPAVVDARGLLVARAAVQG